eukprot:TRINITY_DN6978_c0_g1_i2.p1 TRINITY_DN6978_c0_g1~~TRINITY_DN6978_c0_g1_i2.p1  ORF type:complete len:128 (+),score=2.96 TRINITY_DN6978_c0_g1_i2:134-517(+)
MRPPPETQKKLEHSKHSTIPGGRRQWGREALIIRLIPYPNHPFLKPIVETVSPGPNSDRWNMIHGTEDGPESKVAWIYGGGTSYTSRANEYYYLFGVHMNVSTGEITLVPCTKEQWDRIQLERGKKG